HYTNDSTVLSSAEKQQVSKGLEKNAEVMSNTHLDQLLEGQPEDVKAEILRINTDARPPALQVALLIPLLAALIGTGVAFRMVREPGPEPAGAAEAVAFGGARQAVTPRSRGEGPASCAWWGSAPCSASRRRSSPRSSWRSCTTAS